MSETESGDIRFFNLTSRIGRLRFLAYGVALMLLLIVPFIIAFALAKVSAPISLAISGLAYIAALVLSISFMVRRLHDLDNSGWWALLIFIPLVNLGLEIYLIFFAGTAGENHYGEEPPPNTGWVILGALVYIAMIPLGIVAAIAIPSYQDYVLRAKTAEALQLAQGAEAAVTQYVHSNNGNWPADLGAIFPAAKQNPAGPYVASITSVTAPNGAAYGVIVTLGSENTGVAIAGKALEVWSQNGIVWYCGPASTNPVDTRYLPTGCHSTDPAPP